MIFLIPIIIWKTNKYKKWMFSRKRQITHMYMCVCCRLHLRKCYSRFMNFDVVMECSKYKLSEEILNNNMTTKIIEMKIYLTYIKMFKKILITYCFNAFYLIETKCIIAHVDLLCGFWYCTIFWYYMKMFYIKSHFTAFEFLD